MPPSTRLETERLILRVPALDDLDRWAELMADENAARFIGGVMPKPVVWRMIMQMVGAWDLTGVSMFSVVEKATGKWIGRVGPWQPHAWPGTEVGWGLHPDAWGKGYAVEAAAASLDYAFDVLRWTTVIHLVGRDNVRSRNVAQRLGSTRRGDTRMPPPFDTELAEVWGQTRDEWQLNRGRVTATTRPSKSPPR
ncbi:MAG TPA: GNAT family N-acetyltransferase [Gemmatimonadaceae bacterium]|nr:GNAT family N-acetyltransferase [Gemmatimonadaceae bacterium]